MDHIAKRSLQCCTCTHPIRPSLVLTFLLPARSYTDSSGALSGHPGARCLIEVKSTRDIGGAGRFFMTKSEWRLAKETSQRRRQRQAESGGTGRVAAALPAVPEQQQGAEEPALVEEGDHLYIVLQVVAGVGGQSPQLYRLLVDPWDMYCRGELELDCQLQVLVCQEDGGGGPGTPAFEEEDV